MRPPDSLPINPNEFTQQEKHQTPSLPHTGSEFIKILRNSSLPPDLLKNLTTAVTNEPFRSAFQTASRLLNWSDKLKERPDQYMSFLEFCVNLFYKTDPVRTAHLVVAAAIDSRNKGKVRILRELEEKYPPQAILEWGPSSRTIGSLKTELEASPTNGDQLPVIIESCRNLSDAALTRESLARKALLLQRVLNQASTFSEGEEEREKQITERRRKRREERRKKEREREGQEEGTDEQVIDSLYRQLLTNPQIPETEKALLEESYQAYKQTLDSLRTIIEKLEALAKPTRSRKIKKFLRRRGEGTEREQQRLREAQQLLRDVREEFEQLPEVIEKFYRNLMEDYPLSITDIGEPF